MDGADAISTPRFLHDFERTGAPLPALPAGVHLFQNVLNPAYSPRHCLQRLSESRISYHPSPQDACLDHICGKEHVRAWALDYSYEASATAADGVGVSIYVAASTTDAFAMLTSGHAGLQTFREILFPDNGGECRFFVDWDEKLAPNSAELRSLTSRARAVRDRVRHLASVFKSTVDDLLAIEAFSARGANASVSDPIVSTTDRVDMLSFHAVFPGYCFQSVTDLLFFASWFQGAWRDHCTSAGGPANYIDALDFATYRKRCRRTMGNKRTLYARKSMKPGHARVLGKPQGAPTQSDFCAHLVWSPTPRNDVLLSSLILFPWLGKRKRSPED